MEIESAKCECCGLREDCTKDYITRVKADFDGKWLCGLCTEAVRDEGRKKGHGGVDEAVKAHMSFYGKAKSNPAVQVADGMRQMLRRRSIDLPALSSSASGSVQSARRRSIDLPALSSSASGSVQSASKKYGRPGDN